MELFALGILSATTIREIAAAAQKTAPRAHMATLAALGCTGEYKANIYRDLKAKLKLQTVKIAEPVLVSLPLWSPSAVLRHQPGLVEAKYPIMLPHELLASLWTHYPNYFKRYVLGEEPLQNFWEHVPVDGPWLRGHPVRRIKDFTKWAIPLRLHGDGVPVAKAKKRSMDVISMSSLVGACGKTWDTKLLLSGIIDAAKSSDPAGVNDTMKAIWKILLWSFAALLKGRWPHADWNNTPWPEGSWRAAKAGHRLCGNYIFLCCYAVPT